MLQKANKFEVWNSELLCVICYFYVKDAFPCFKPPAKSEAGWHEVLGTWQGC